MVAVGAVVGEVSTSLALALRRRERPVRIEDCFVEELARLLLPNAQSARVDRRHQRLDVLLREAAAEVARRRRVRDPLRAERVEVALVLPEPLDVFEAAAAGEDVERDVQDVIGLVVGHVRLEDRDAPVNLGHEPHSLRERVHHADASGRDPLGPTRHFVADVDRPHHRPLLRWPVARHQPPHDRTLAILRVLACNLAHSKRLRWLAAERSVATPFYAKPRDVSSTFMPRRENPDRSALVLGLSASC